VDPSNPSEPLPSILSLMAELTHQRKESAHLSSIASDLTEKVEWVNKHYPALLDREKGALRVVSLGSNPSHTRIDSKRSRDIEEARAEIKVLRARVEELQGGSSGLGAASFSAAGASSAAIVELESRLSMRIRDLEKALSDSEKKSLRLKEIFSTRVTEFRGACYALTGYRIELTQASSSAGGGGGIYRLKSIYSAKEEDHLLFRLTPPAADGSAGSSSAAGETGVDVMETPFTSTLDPSLTNYLSRANAVPAFLAAVTLHLRDKMHKGR
jgi:hypothetical protein